jgi:DNA-binding cell septation regulator SpoVG
MPQAPRSTRGPREIAEVRIRPVPNGSDGLLAFASCRYGGVLLNDIAIRRDATGNLYLTYPRKLGSTGRPHPLHHPIDRETAEQFEAAILGQLRQLMGGGEGSDRG